MRIVRLAQAGGARLCVSVCALWRGAAAAVVLAPRQRVAQFAEDAWTRLWAALCALAAPRTRLRPDHVRARLAVSLHCYQVSAGRPEVGHSRLSCLKFGADRLEEEPQPYKRSW